MSHHHRALRGPLSTLITLATLAGAPMALAGGGDVDFAAEAKRRMNLSFDLDEVEGMLQQDIPQAYPSAVMAPLPLEPNSEMAAVTVFRDRALVTRVLDARTQPGDSSVTFEGLPLGLAADSLHATVLKGDARIIGVELLSGRGEVEETDRIQGIRDEMLGITEELGQVRDRIESLLAQRTYLRDTLLQDRSQAPAPSLDQIRGTLGFVGDAERDIAAQLRTEQERARELDEELRPLLIKLENPLATGNQVRVDLAAVSGGPITVGLRYQVFGAGWWPAYNARLDEESAQVTLEYYGIVSQSTGEDWEAVELELSTANPSVSGELPSLSSWYLGRNTYGSSYSVQDNLMSGRGYYDMSGNEMQANPQTVVPQGLVESRMNASVQGTGAVVFAIPGDRTIAGDGSEQRLPVGTQTFAAVMELATVPKLVPEVYRQARMRYQGEAPLLPGTVASFVGSDYVGSGQLATVVPGEELLISFGTDDRMRVERQLVERQQDYVGAGKRTVRWTLHFRIKLSNFSEQAQTVRLVDQVPVSEMDRVTVKLLDTTPPLPPAEDDGPGILKWKLTPAAGTEEYVDLRFSVTAPAEVYIQDMMF